MKLSETESEPIKLEVEQNKDASNGESLKFFHYDEKALFDTFIDSMKEISPYHSRIGSANEDFSTIVGAIKNHEFFNPKGLPMLYSSGDDQLGILKIFEKHLGISTNPEHVSCYKEIRTLMRETEPQNAIKVEDEITAINFLATCIAYNISERDKTQVNAISKSIADTLIKMLSASRVHTLYYMTPGSRQSLFTLAYLISTHQNPKLNFQMALDFKYDKEQFDAALKFMLLAGVIGNIMRRDDYGTHILNQIKTDLNNSPRNLTESEIDLVKNYLPVRLKPAVEKEATAEEIWKKENIIEFATYTFKDKYIDEEDVLITYTKTTKEAIEKINGLRDKYPNFLDVIDMVEKNLKLALINNKPFKIPPICLRGPSGTGKTCFANALVECLDLPKLMIHSSQITCGSVLTGLQKTWGNASQGLITQIVQDSKKINPVVVIDEFSNLLTPVYSNGVAIEAALLNLLDPNEAKNYADGYSRVSIDLSHVSWIFATNHLNGISEPLRKRIQVFEISPPRSQDAHVIAKNIFIDAIRELSLEDKIDTKLSDIGLQSLTGRVRDKEDYRSIKAQIKDAVLNFAMDNLEHLQETGCAKLIVPPKILQTEHNT